VRQPALAAGDRYALSLRPASGQPRAGHTNTYRFPNRRPELPGRYWERPRGYFHRKTQWGVISNSKIARASDYVALLRDLAQFTPIGISS